MQPSLADIQARCDRLQLEALILTHEVDQLADRNRRLERVVVRQRRRIMGYRDSARGEQWAIHDEPSFGYP
jgi:hypothetical protein